MNALTVSQLTVRFGDFTALEDVTFSLPEGAFLAIIGPNGAGKSTLLNVLLGLRPPTSGEVQVFETAPGALPGPQLGYIPQVKTLDRSFPGVALELVATGLHRTWPWRISVAQRAQALAALEQTGAANVADRPIAKLSGGELQRVYLARSLVRRPRLMVLDEPAAGMDVIGEADMYHRLGHYQEQTGATVVMITHDWEGARFHATHVLLLNRALIGFGPPAEVAREENLLRVFGHRGHVHATHGTPPHA
jgi:zinc transport system ATP-binding protein